MSGTASTYTTVALTSTTSRSHFVNSGGPVVKKEKEGALRAAPQKSQPLLLKQFHLHSWTRLAIEALACKPSSLQTRYVRLPFFPLPARQYLAGAVVVTTITMAAVDRPSANHCRKRSYDLVRDNEPSFRSKSHYQQQYVSGNRPVTSSSKILVHRSPPPKRRSVTAPGRLSMPVHIASMSTTYPSFMSVYGSDEGQIESEQAELSQVQTKEQELPLSNITLPKTHQLPFSIVHRGSITSFTTESTTSSPTTTHSSPVFTDPSPASSPESASTNPPLSHFGRMPPSNHERHHTLDQPFVSQQTDLLPIYPQPSPNNPDRNVKKLSLNMSASVLPRPPSSSGVESFHNFSAPTSPLKEPLRSARKKPTNLTIRTPGFQQLTFGRSTPDVPPTPSSRPSLQHFQTSPSLPSLSTPTTSSSGLHLSLPSFGSGHSRPGSDSSFSSHCASSILPELKEEFEPHKSQETQEKGYPSGPVQIYDSGVYLYLEPNVDEAGRFDTIINVAKEIRNPFESTDGDNRTVMSVWRDNSRASMDEPQTAVSEKSFQSAWEFQPAQTPTVETPKAQSENTKRPEYIHVPWDHNSEILADLYPLCKLIDDRVQEGKKVLIHCQLGVSRSASLIIAYGLYKGYQPDFHTMYMQVKDRSQWVGPNMSLIYQLTDFRGKVARGEYLSGGRAAPNLWFKNRAVATSTGSLRSEVSSLSLAGQPESMILQTEDVNKTPTAKPLRSIKLDKELPPVPPFPSDDKPRMMSHIAAQMAPPAKPNSKRAASPGPSRSNSTNRHIKLEPRQLPFRKLQEYSVQSPIPPHRPRHAPPKAIKIEGPPSQMDLATQDVPSTPSMFSPRATEFLASPFGISSSAGDLFSGPKSARSVKSIPPPTEDILADVVKSKRKPRESVLPSEVDPRSPHQPAGQGEILRHIDDVL